VNMATYELCRFHEEFKELASIFAYALKNHLLVVHQQFVNPLYMHTYASVYVLKRTSFTL